MKFNTMKKTIAMVGAVAMLGSLAACGGSDAKSSSSGSSDEKINLTVWAWDSTVPRTVEGFEKANPNIKVKIDNVGTNTKEYQALDNALQAGSGAPDVAQVEYYALPQYAIGEHLQDLTQYGADKFSDFFTTGTWNSVNVQGGVFGLPIDSGPMAFFYNKEVFDKAGVDATQIKTWDDFYEAAKKIKAVGSYITSDSGDAGFYDSMVWASGGHPFSIGSDGQSVKINLTDDEGAKKWNEYWQKMIDEDLIDTKTVGWTDDWNRGLNDGSIAALLTGAWMPYNLLSGAPDATGKWRITQMPSWDASKPMNAESGGSSLAVIKTDDAAKAEAAYKFVEYVAHNKDGIKVRVDGGAFPADKETLADKDFLAMTALKDKDGKDVEYFGGQKYNEELAKAAENVLPGYNFLPYEVYARGKYGDFVTAFAGKGTIADGVAAWQKDLVDYGNQQGFKVN